MKDFRVRDEIVFGEPVDWSRNRGGIKSFKGMDHDALAELVQKGFADPQTKQNDSPSIAEFLSLLQKYGGSVDGYLVSPFQRDCRVAVDSITIPIPCRGDKKFVLDMIDLARTASEIDETDSGIRFWWD